MSTEESLSGNAQSSNEDNVPAEESREDVQVADSKQNIPSYDWHKRGVGDNRKLKG